MADTKATGLAELAGPPADNDMLYLADVSDTTMASSGTSKKSQAKNYLRTNGTANTLGANLDANGYNITGAGTVTITNRLAVGTATAGYPLHVSAPSGVQSVIDATSGQYTQVTLQNAGVDKFSWGWDNSAGFAYIAADSATITLDGGRIGFTSEVGDAWTNVTFNTGWGHFYNGYQTMQYKKVGDLVFVRGMVIRSSGSSYTICTLPSGYRPSLTSFFPVTSADLFAYATIDAGGNIALAGGAPTVWVALGTLVFSTA